MDLEYDNGIKSLQLERDKIRQTEKKKPRRKIPKAGCYPSGFSEFTMKRVACTISLSELRKDVSALNFDIQYPSQSVYFEESDSVDAMRPISPTVTCAKTHRQPDIFASAPRNCRRKLTQTDYLLPRSIAEERRQLQAVLRQSIMEQPKVPLSPAAHGLMHHPSFSKFDKLQYRGTDLDRLETSSLLDRNASCSSSLVPSA